MLVIFQIQAYATGSFCFDYSDLNSSVVTCYYGDFYNPYSDVGVVAERHTVITDTISTDEYTGGKLKLVPPGETKSVRLGNSNTGAEAEAVTYKIHVDIEQFQLLFLKYAVVLENPGHEMIEQPRFTLEILDENNDLVTPECGFADYYAGFGSDWNDDDDINWKDWSINGFDLTEYDGKTIYVRLTTYDCEQSGHFGYAYYTLTCGEKQIEVYSCKNSVTAKLKAPDGYAYEWYKSSEPNIILSTEQYLEVIVDETDYSCRCSALHNRNCNFTITAKAAQKFPVAQFELDSPIFNNCEANIKTRNSSELKDKYGEVTGNCEEYKWLLPEGRTDEAYNTTATITRNGDFDIGLISFINEKSCSDTVYKHISISQLNPFEENVRKEICDGEKFHYREQDFEQTVIYTESYKTIYGCDSVYTLDLTVNPTYFLEKDTILCADSVFFRSRLLEGSGTYYDSLKTTKGCDSIFLVRFDIVQPPQLEAVTLHERAVELVAAHGKYPYRFSIDGEPYTDGCVFFDLHFGKHMVSIVDDNLCKNEDYFIIDNIPLSFPMYFTPNGDGLNDTWNITNIDLYNTIDLKIYDRFGKLLRTIIDPMENFDGMYNGKKLPSTDYWYILSTPETGKRYVGHFTLVN
ncbi:MAG: T9SS type B sorting domain-containing protein [Bacteroidales bacterium]|nr:T9SS type B sorting domain-containing protein [Bacteroidales bacterium]